MNAIREVIAIFVSWSQLVAGMIVAALERLVAPRRVRLDELPDGRFALRSGGRDSVVTYQSGRLAGADLAALKGSRVEIGLQPSRFLFRTLELPAQAAEFLDGIVGAQIDRLTPWTAQAAAFGCAKPVAIECGRIATTIAVAPRAAAAEVAAAALALQPAAVAVDTVDERGARITVLEEKAQRFLSTPRLGRALLVALGLFALAAAASAIADAVISRQIDARRLAVLQEIAQIQARSRIGAASPDETALRALEKRKYDTPSATLVLESLSQHLPDNTYATELHINGDKMQLVGISGDAPSLIRLLEQSRHFTRATFYAPTTRAQNDPGERFHIEARLEPVARLER